MENYSPGNFEVEVETVIKLMEDHVKIGGKGEETKQDEQLKSAGNQSGCIQGEANSSTGIFSEELWETVLNRLLNSEDILNVLRAFHELHRVFQGKKANWLFDQVLPHLLTKHLTVKKVNIQLSHCTSTLTGGDDHNWTYSYELLKLRGVSKRWKKVVEGSLQDHPDRHPPPSLSTMPLNRKPVALPVDHFNSQRMFRYNLGATLFTTCKQIEKFLESMRLLTSDHNPFPGKLVVLKPDIQWYSKSLPLLQSAVHLFKRFGKHVTTLEISFWDQMTSDSNLPLCKAVLDCLSHLPNLRSLTLKGGLKGGEYAKEANTIFGKPESQMFFPELSALNTFVCQVRYKDKFSIWINRMLETYGRKDGLLKLGIQHDKYWTSYLSPSLTALSELHLFVDYDCSPNLGGIEKVLKSLPNAQNLKKFGLSYIPLPAIGDEAVDITKLIGMLAGGNFQIETLVLENLVLMEEPLPNKADTAMKMKTLSSVTSLCLQDDKKLSYGFLKMLPNLRWLTDMQLEANEYTQDFEGNMERWELAGEEGDVTEFAKSLRKFMLQAKYGIMDERQDFGELWVGLPKKLEMICGSVEQAFRNVVDVQFVIDCGNQAFVGWRLEEDEEGQGMDGDEEGQGMDGDEEGQGMAGDEEGQGMAGDEEGQGIAGDEEGQGMDGDEEGQGMDGDEEGQGMDGDEEGQGMDGDEEGQGMDGDEEGQGMDGDEEWQGMDGYEDWQGMDGYEDWQGMDGYEEGCVVA